jgi:cytochrome oxidase Cu insertion factor (SCO1/SenC/PrrC family)
LRDLSGRVVVLSFIYTHCKTTCPLLTQELKQLQEALGPLMGREVVFLSLTIDPQRDTPAVLKRYGEVHGVDFRSWRFLTGSEGTMRQILEAYHVPVRVEKPSGAHADGYELGHGNPIYLIDQWGRVRKRTAPTMLVRLGRPAIEWLVREGASDVNADADLVQLGEKGKP